jgi:PKD repeat protein
MNPYLRFVLLGAGFLAGIAVWWGFPGTAIAFTIVGDQPIDTVATWTASGSPYVLIGNLTIGPSGVLDVQANVSVEATGDFAILVDGTLRALAPSGPVSFGLAPNATTPDWAGIQGRLGATVSLAGAVIDKARVGVECSGCNRLTLMDINISGAGVTGLRTIDTPNISLGDIWIQSAGAAATFTNATNLNWSGSSTVAGTDGVRIANSTGVVLSGIRAVATAGGALNLDRASNTSCVDLRLNGSSPSSIMGVTNVTLWQLMIERAGVSLGNSSTGVTIHGFRIEAVSGRAVQANVAATVLLLDGFIGAGSSQALYFRNTQGLRIENVWIDASPLGVYLETTQDVLLENVTIVAGGTGVLAMASVNLQLHGSTIVNGTGYSVSLDSVDQFTAWGNNFVGCAAGAKSNGGSTSAWSSGGVGNFWFPANLTDSDANGIGDLPIDVPGSSGETDNYPAMLAFWNTPPGLAGLVPLSGPEDASVNVSADLDDLLGRLRLTWTVGGDAAVIEAAGHEATLVFPTPGIVLITIRATNLANLTSMMVVPFRAVDSTPPAAVCAGPAYADAGTAAQFSSQDSTDNDPSLSGPPVTSWAARNASGVLVAGANNSTTFSWIPPFPGAYQVTCTLSDLTGNTNSSQIPFVARDVLPPRMGARDTLVVNEDVPFGVNASAVTDDDPEFSNSGSIRWVLSISGATLLDRNGWSFASLLAEPGRYNLTIVACDQAGNCANATGLLVVIDTTPPDVSAVGTFQVKAGAPARLGGENVTDNDPGFPNGASFSWQIDNGSGPLNLGGVYVVVLFEAPGVYRGTLTATDASGNVASGPFEVHALDQTVPDVELDVPRAVELGEEGVFDCSRSTDSSTPLSAVWDFDDGSAPVAGLRIVHRFLRVANLAVTVTVADAAGNGRSSTFALKVVDTRAPSILVTEPAGGERPLGVAVGQRVSFSAIAEDLSGPVSVVWDFGDGESQAGKNAMHGYSAPGTYVVNITARDASGNSNSTLLEVTVAAPPQGYNWLLPAALVSFAVFGVALLAWRRSHPKADEAQRLPRQ